MTSDERKKIYAALAAPFPAEAVERTDGKITGKGYSTTGIKYQFIVNRLNEVLGLGGFRVERKVDVKEIQTSKGRTAFEATCEVHVQLGDWEKGAFIPFAEAIADGGHVSMTQADAIKGSYTNGIKKCVAFFGVGKQAYEGSLDDDNIPSDGFTQPVQERATNTTTPQPIPAVEPARVPAQQPRSRLTSKQLNALWAIAHNQGYGDGEFRSQVLKSYGVQPEFLTKDMASKLITSLGGNGKNHQYEQRQIGAEG